MTKLAGDFLKRFAVIALAAGIAVTPFGGPLPELRLSQALATGDGGGGDGGGGNGGGDGNQIDFSKPKVKRNEPIFELPSQRKQKVKQALAPEIRELAGFIKSGVDQLRTISDLRRRIVSGKARMIPVLGVEADRVLADLDKTAAKLRAELKNAAIQLDTYLALAGIETGSSAMVSRASSQAKNAGR